MPQLASGRHVALSISPYLDALTHGSDESRYFATVALRLNASNARALRGHVVVGCFDDGAGTPPDAPCHDSGFCVDDILQGRSDWRADEVEEMRAILATPRFEAWLQAQFEELDQAIRDNPLWKSDLLMDGGASADFDEASIKRAVILRSASAADAMLQLRRVRRC